MEMAKPAKEHAFLQRLVGDWTVTMEGGDDHPGMDWTETVRSLHGLWVVGEARGEVPGMGAVSNIITLGFDPAKGRYVGTFVTTMMTHLWVYEGAVDASGNNLVLQTEGPDMTGAAASASYEETIAFLDENHRTFTSRTRGADGRWSTLMTMHYRRKG